MIKGIYFFTIVWTLVMSGIWGFAKMSNSDKWTGFKIALYGALTAALATFIVVGIVVLF